MTHNKAREWDRRLKAMFDEIDAVLEEHYGGEFNLHPNRPKRGETSNPEMDGLFNIGADFTAGYGSQYGRGYIVQVSMSTLDQVPVDIRHQIENEVEDMVRQKLPDVFPERKLELERDGNLLKIIGDFRLGSVLQE